jgi:hypothetical protein
VKRGCVDWAVSHVLICSFTDLLIRRGSEEIRSIRGGRMGNLGLRILNWGGLFVRKMADIENSGAKIGQF